MKMTSFRDDSSATRCANGVSAIDFLENNMTNSSNVTITPTSTDEKNTSSNEKNQQQNDKSLHDSKDDDEARAFKSQFDEIKCASRMLEYSKNNAYNRFQGPAGRVPSAPKRNCETSFHQRSHSHSSHPQQTNRQMLKHQRSISSIQGLSFNGNSSAFKFCSTHGLPPTPFTSYGFDSPLHYFDDSSSVNGNDDALMKFRDIENGSGRFGFNNNRFGSNADEWDDSSSGYLSSGYPSTPLSNGPFTPLPLTPPSTYSSLSPSTPYFAQPHSLLDDDELLEKAKRLEEERLLLQIQQRKLDDAIAAHKLRYHHSDPSLSETEAKYKLNNTTPPLVPTRGKPISSQMKPSFGSKLTMPLTRLQNLQEPIGTPIRKSEYSTPPSTTPTGSSNSSLSTSAPTFSLFSNPPALSLNHNLLNQQQKYHRTMSSDNNSLSLNGKFSGYPLTPSSSPPKTNDEGYFGFCSYNNANNNIWVNNNENNYYNPLTPTTMPTSPAFYFRAPLYSSPVDEREEDSLYSDEYFNLNNRKNYENNFTNYAFATDDHHWID